MARRQRHSAVPSLPTKGTAQLDKIFDRAGLGREAREYRLLAAWAQIAGPRILANARAERLLGTALVIRVKSSGWSHQLSLMQAELLARLHAVPGGMSVRELRFSVGPLEDVPSWEVEPRLLVPLFPPHARPAPADDGQVASALLEVRDPHLRVGLADLYARCRLRP